MVSVMLPLSNPLNLTLALLRATTTSTIQYTLLLVLMVLRMSQIGSLVMGTLEVQNPIIVQFLEIRLIQLGMKVLKLRLSQLGIGLVLVVTMVLMVLMLMIAVYCVRI